MSTLQATDILNWIVAQASSLSERVSDPSIRPLTIDEDNAAVLDRLETWQRTSAKGDLDRFSQRLAADGLDLREVRAYLGDVVYDDQQPLPAWATTLDAVMKTADRWSKQAQHLDWRFSTTTEEIAFESFYGPCLEVAIERLAENLSAEQLQQLSETATLTLRFSLVEQLQSISASVLFQEFSQFRSTGNVMRDFFVLQFQGRKSKTKYHEFLNNFFEGGYRSLFEIYPVLGRLIATAINFWVEATTEFLRNLSSDWAKLEQQFSQAPLTQVTTLNLGLSDTHNRGRTTISLQFDTGLKLIYKPKDLGTDIAYFQFLDWCNRHGLALPFKCLTVLNQGTHGWVEFVEAIACEDKDAAHRFYQRSGILLCLVHLLEGTDCHYENLIAHGEHPVLIDTETLLTHRMKIWNVGETTPVKNALQRVEQQLSESVLRTLLLPHRQGFNNDQIDLDLSGFGGIAELQQVTPKLRDINTDGMQIEYATITIQPHENVATLNGQILSPDDYVEDLVEGFLMMASFLRQHQTQLLSEESPLNNFANQTVRYIFRNTNTYGTILQQSYQPDYLKAGIDRSIHLEVLCRGFLTESVIPPYWGMLSIECQAMEQMDIPFFTLNSSRSELLDADIFERSSFEQVYDRIQQLDQAEIDRQVQIIRGTFDARGFTEPAFTGEIESRSVQEIVSSTSQVPSKEALIQQAIQVGEWLEAAAIVGEDDSITWLGIVSRGKLNGFEFGNVGTSLADGSCGIALFLAGLYQTTQNSRWSDLALRALQPLRQVFQQKDTRSLDSFIRQQGMSGTTGLAGIVYGLMQIGRLLQQSELRLEAHRLASWLPANALTVNQGYDVNQGLAGTILGLLALPEDDDALHLATIAGECLLTQKAQLEQGYSKNSPDFLPSTGFHRGLAGAAYALLRLFAITQDGRFCQAAIDIIDYERQLLSTANLSPSQASGIGLARLGGLAMINTDEMRQEIEQALRVTQQYTLWGVDSLYLGNCGRLEMMLVAAQQFDRPELHQITQQTAMQLITDAKRDEGFVLFNDRRGTTEIPGLFHGVAGIGYQMLRLANSELPSVLLWETSGGDNEPTR